MGFRLEIRDSVTFYVRLVVDGGAQFGYSLLASDVVELLVKVVEFLLELSELALEILVFLFQLFNIRVRWSAETLLDEPKSD